MRQVGQGTGSLLVAERLRRAAAAGCCWITAEALEANPLGRAHLLRHGFQPTAARRISNPLEPMDVGLWVRALDDQPR